MMVKEGTQVFAHQWDAREGKWVKIGSVVGGSGGSQQASGKQLFEGKVNIQYSTQLWKSTSLDALF